MYIDDERRNIYGPLRDSKKKAVADLNFIRDSATAGGAVEQAASLKLPAGVQSSIQHMSLCGLNIQYPWSRLIMAGRKTTEVRKFALGHYSCFSEGDQIFLIETLGRGSTEGAIVDVEVGPPPSEAQVLGVVTFAGCFEFRDYDDFHGHRQDTCIAGGSHFDWWSIDAESLFAWVVQDVNVFDRPVKVGQRRKSMLGWTRPVDLSFSFQRKTRG